MIARLQQLPLAIFATFFLFALTSCAPTLAMEDDWQDFVPHSGQSILDELNRRDVVELTLTANFDSLLNNRNSEEYLPASFAFENEKGVQNAYQIKVKTRGKFRRRICDFPPLKLKFSKDELEAAGFSDMNELKLVTHCAGDKLEGNEQVLREFLIYKMYNELTPISFRVQLAKITYRDSSGKNKKVTRWGFLIEDDEELEARRVGHICECMGQGKDSLQATHERMVSLFQYMIGNVDWDYQMLRNVKLLRTADEKLIPVPYDFDFSALVNASYARISADLGQQNIRERFFLGMASSADEIFSTISYFKSKKEALYKLLWNFKYLNDEARAEMAGYLDSFYLIIEDKARAQTEIFDMRQSAMQDSNR
jgi:hypothetical protein